MSKWINNWIRWWRWSTTDRRSSLRQFVSCGNQLYPNPALGKGRKLKLDSPLCQRRLRGIKQRLLLTVLVITIISACSSTKIKHNETLTIESSLTPCRVVQHAMGEACIPDHPKRVITISSYAALLGDTLALGINPIGNTVYIDEELRKSYLVDKINGIKLIGDPFNPNLEKILLLKPDLILAWDNVERIYPILSKIAPTVIFSWKDRIAGNWKESFNFTAEIFRKKAVAQQVLSNYHHRVEELKWLSQSSYARIA